LRVLITGGAGFIGSNLTKALLKRGHWVRVIDNFSTGDRRNLEGLAGNLEIVEGDVTSPQDCAQACAGMDVVSHQAALGSVPRSVLDPELYSWNNLHGFVVLCNQARLAGIQRIVYASSSAVYGDLEVSPKRETMRGHPLSPYAASKQGNEDFAFAFYNAYGMTMVGFRYFNVFGPCQNPNGPYAAVIPLFISKLMKGESPTIFGDGLQSRDFTYVENVIQANLKALLGDVPLGSHLVNVACGDHITVLDLFKGIARLVGSELRPIHAPDRKGDIRNSLADIQVARELLGYNDWTPFSEGLVATVDWYRQHPERLA
jgi:nucleoside-diphosphate-sugar epimerase